PTFLREFLDPDHFMIYTLTRFPHGINLNLNSSSTFHVFLISADQFNENNSSGFDVFWNQLAVFQGVESPLILLLPSTKPVSGLLQKDLHQSFIQKMNEIQVKQFNAETFFPYLTKNFFDFYNYFLTGSGYSKEFLNLLSCFLKHIRDFKFSLKKKLVIIDLDETLWPGILAEGKEGIYGTDEVETKIYQQFQAEIRELKSLGYVLALCSKNNFPDVLDVMSRNSEIHIGINDFVNVSASWEPKDIQIRNILSQTGFAENQTVFIDNSEFERELVRKAFPDLAIFDFQKSPIKRLLSIKTYFGFYNPFITDEDLNRTVLYQQNDKRKLLKSEVSQIDEWIRELDPTLSVLPLNDMLLERARQLMLRTNQFNINADKANFDRYFVEWKQSQRTMKVFSYKDRFGDDGIIGLISWVEMDDRFVVDQFILSCRVFGRKIEHAIMKYVQTIAQSTIEKTVFIKAVTTQKNQAGLDFLNTSNLFSWISDSEYQMKVSPVLEGYQILVYEEKNKN
ncbi:MAG: HAD-IIIC family phosphatase, partial [Pseudobdellovibrionaceae bacterium]